jgi:hypothetical protein
LPFSEITATGEPAYVEQSGPCDSSLPSGGVSTSTLIVEAVLDAAPKTRRLPKVGSLYRGMLPTQPPIKSLIHFYPLCCRDFYDPVARPLDPVAPFKPRGIACETGITLGHLLDAAGPMIEAHRTCPNPSWTELNEEGYVGAAIRFEGQLEVGTHSPDFRAGCDSSLVAGSPTVKESETDVLLMSYAYAKMTAWMGMWYETFLF